MNRRRVVSMRLVIVSLALLSCSGDLLAGAPVRTPTQNDLLQGTYSFVLHGTYSGNPYAASGVLTFDGAGNITDGSATFVVDTFVVSGDLLDLQPNTYVVQSDGTGTLRVHFPVTSGFGLKCALAVADHGRMLYLNTIGLRAGITFEDIVGPTATGEASQQQ
jgi:hypothetical protein